jgi:hypothetical protein
MTDEKMQKEESNRPGQTKPEPEQEHREAPQPQASAAAQLGHRVTPGRRPLFRTEVVSGRR